MARMRPPAVPDDPPPVLRAEELERLLGACADRAFGSRRGGVDEMVFESFVTDAEGLS